MLLVTYDMTIREGRYEKDGDGGQDALPKVGRLHDVVLGTCDLSVLGGVKSCGFLFLVSLRDFPYFRYLACIREARPQARGVAYSVV
jgi:hypothetical protein